MTLFGDQLDIDATMHRRLRKRFTRMHLCDAGEPGYSIKYCCVICRSSKWIEYCIKPAKSIVKKGIVCEICRGEE